MGEDLSPPPAAPSKKRLVVETAATGGAGMVPVVGSLMAASLAAVLGAVHQRRTHEWMEELAQVVQALIDKVEGLEEDMLAVDDDFYDATIAASRIAISTTAVVKHRALQNALFNVGVGDRLDADKRAIYLRYVEDLTPSHLTLLDFLDNPPRSYEQRGLAWPQLLSGGLMAVLEPLFPSWAADRPFLDTLMADLVAMGLTNTSSLSGMMTAEGLRAQRSSEKGREFMRFVSGPFGEPEQP